CAARRSPTSSPKPSRTTGATGRASARRRRPSSRRSGSTASTATWRSRPTRRAPRCSARSPTTSRPPRRRSSTRWPSPTTPAARVWLGSYNFSPSADKDNGENLLLFRDRRIATAYAVEALRIYDHYDFRATLEAQSTGAQPLRRPPRAQGEVAWWRKFYDD